MLGSATATSAWSMSVMNSPAHRAVSASHARRSGTIVWEEDTWATYVQVRTKSKVELDVRGGHAGAHGDPLLRRAVALVLGGAVELGGDARLAQAALAAGGHADPGPAGGLEQGGAAVDLHRRPGTGEA